jgi:prepilin-type processing-associated H-X9-DG protein
MVIACEPLSNHGDGINVLFGDGHVEFVGLPDATTILSDVTTGKLPVKWPPPSAPSATGP